MSSVGRRRGTLRQPQAAAGLSARAQAIGITPESYVQRLVEQEFSAETVEDQPSEGSGMVWEKGLFVYRDGNPLPAHIIDDAIRRSREERTQTIPGNIS